MAEKKKATKSKVNEAGNYTKPGLRKRLFEKIKAGSKGGDPGEWSARKAQLLASEYAPDLHPVTSYSNARPAQLPSKAKDETECPALLPLCQRPASDASASK